MKKVLEYTEDELLLLSDDELNLLLIESKNNESLYNTRQLVEKTIINSVYGALDNKWFSLFNESIAAAITSNGRFFIRKLAISIEESLQKISPQKKQYVIYSDTDSVYFQVEAFVEKFISQNPGLSINGYVDFADKFEKKVIQQIIQKTIDDFASQLNAFNKDKIIVEREIIADVAVFTAKKKYYARVRDLEGLRYPIDSPKIKIIGLEVIKSSTPKWSKKYLKEAIPHIFDSDESGIRKWVKKIKKEFTKSNLNDISASGGVSRIDYDLKNDTVPIGSRAAICHNNYIKKHNLTSKFTPIQGGDKCKRIFLIEPNIFDSNIVAYTNDEFADEIEKYDCVDFDTNFEKNFLKPLYLMVESLGYQLERETDELSDW